jgi:hypothetical protein
VLQCLSEQHPGKGEICRVSCLARHF